jgi:REP-associated tyrosine transposase
VPHRRRPLHHRGQPVHVTLRAVRGLPSLRGVRLFRVLRRGLAAASAATFRVVHLSVQANHVHLLVEAEGTQALGRGMQGLGIRLAKAINRKHGAIGRGIDPCSSGAWFGGWRDGVEPSLEPAPVARPQTWLLRVGWRRSGPIGVDEAPAAPGRRAGRSRARFKTPAALLPRA